MKLLSIGILLLGLVDLCAFGYVNTTGRARNIEGDGFDPQQSMTATILGYDRDIVCTWGDDGVRSEADRRLGQDDGQVHDHWMCDAGNVVLRPRAGQEPSGKYEGLARMIGPGTEILSVLALWLIGGVGLFVTRERY